MRLFFARLLFPGLLTTVPLYSNHGTPPTRASLEAHTCSVLRRPLISQEGHLQQPDSLDACSYLQAEGVCEEHLSISSRFLPRWRPVDTSLDSSSSNHLAISHPALQVLTPARQN